MKKPILLLSALVCVISISVKAQDKLNIGDTLYSYAINFDSPVYNPYIHLDTANHNNVWQIGHPQKIIFSSAYSAPNVIMTDTINNYPVNNHSYFDLYIGDFNLSSFYPMDIIIDFLHKYNTDTLKDGGYISVSWDKGISWMNIINDTVYPQVPPVAGWPGLNLYTNNDVLYNGEFGFSGNSHGWIRTLTGWHYIPVKLNFPPDTMIVRFNFISDNLNNNKEGWMIDNLRIFSIDFGSGIQNFSNKNDKITISPNPATTSFTLTYPDKQNLSLSIYNIFGEIVQQRTLTKSTDEIDISSLAKGVYIINVSGKDWTAQRKLVKE